MKGATLRASIHDRRRSAPRYRRRRLNPFTGLNASGSKSVPAPFLSGARLRGLFAGIPQRAPSNREISPVSLLPFLTLAVVPTASDAAGPAPRHPVSVHASTGDRSVVLHWRAAKNLKRIRIYRRRQGHNWLRAPIATVDGGTRS